ncbi:Bifunctional dehydrogenase and ferrochelatase [Podospora pseudoanserina]|uniref:precorrin-2 dehydrogenase n=1 Tax=Podospora pseudoanserina TaxID=2609844 RepID=A0ABR0IBR6_9PEZI|nr:Bifunctional dehydrogenase and ferrochelatase [Podospora pseudoanserina]
MVTLEWRFRSRLLFHPSRHRHVFFSAANPFRASITIVATAKTHGGMAESRPQEKYPAIQGGGSLMIAWQVKGKPVLVIGGGEVAAGRIVHLLNADAVVTVICPSSGLNAEVSYRVAQKQVTHVDRIFLPSDLDDKDWSMVLVAIDDPAASTQIWKLCKQKRLVANIADVPPECDFYFGSVHRDGPLQIMVSTNGKGPRLASMIRRFIAKQLPSNAGRAIEAIGELRVKLRQVAPKPEEGPKRMSWMKDVSDRYSWEEMCEMTDEDMTNLLTFYEPNRVPSFHDLRGMRASAIEAAKADVFDGSFGFSVGA